MEKCLQSYEKKLSTVDTFYSPFPGSHPVFLEDCYYNKTGGGHLPLPPFILLPYPSRSLVSRRDSSRTVILPLEIAFLTGILCHVTRLYRSGFKEKVRVSNRPLKDPSHIGTEFTDVT